MVRFYSVAVLIGGALLSGFLLLDSGSNELAQAEEHRAIRTQHMLMLADTLPVPCLDEEYDYTDANLPWYYTKATIYGGDLPIADNTPEDNHITNAGATLGRVLFYYKRLSFNNTIACASCHQQEHNFSDPRQKSLGLHGGETNRHAMSLANARYYFQDHFFWDERAATLEDQILVPIQDPVEMGMTLEGLNAKLEQTSFYPELFEKAFGDDEITSDRISKALSQFVRSLTTYNSKFDKAWANENQEPNYEAVFTPQEMRGLELFMPLPNKFGISRLCSDCHRTAAHVAHELENNGLDSIIQDEGAVDGKFKVPSLRNIAVSAPYMHDGRFKTLREVVEFYNTGVQKNHGLSPILREGPSVHGDPRRMNFTEEDIDAVIAFLHTLTDTTFLNDPKFADPFCAQTTSVPNMAQDLTGVTLSPNPATGVTTITLPNARRAHHLRLYTLEGRQLWETTTSNSHYVLTIESLAAGQYYLEVNDGMRKTTVKLVVQ